ncbi:MAG: hypothetical protein A4E65_02740 [Syntrophorhabdus sp. PtaU1.Bin153]|nr:MAG: hypothetical protein A4E65_02740 [Syntrophorhabdus sp. PtaU1.Bin153]
MGLIKQGKGMILSLLACFLIVVATSCTKFGTTKIGDIVNHPRDYAEKEVSIFGEVTETFSLLVVKYFTVRDGTGEITVITERPLPAKGEKIKITGTVKEAFSMGPTTSLVIVEVRPETPR